MNSFLHFIDPYLAYIDTGKLFRHPMKFLYGLLAIVSLVLPIVLFIGAARNGIFRSGFGGVVAFLLIWFIIAFACWLGFQLWWDRKDRLADIVNSDDEFAATPIFSHFVQTLGEWSGTFVAIVGAGISLIGGLFGNAGRVVYSLGLPDFLGGAIWGVFLMPLFGLLMIIVFRLVAEQLRALVSIANNTNPQKNKI
jgi:hypothetical protein